MSEGWIEALNRTADVWQEALIRASWQGAIFAAIAWLVCRFWKRMPASTCCLIWLLVCLKMLVALFPVALALPLLPAEAQGPVLSIPFPEGVTVPTSATPLIEEPIVRLGLGSCLFLAWLVGAFAVAGAAWTVLLRIKRLVREAACVEDPSIVADANELARQMGLRKAPPLKVTESGIKVLTLGARKPVILISRSVLAACSPEEIRLILAHELAHLKRHDGWLALLPQATTALYFFNPAAWLASKEFELARESACDELAVRHLSASTNAYGQLLLKLCSERQWAGSPLALGISSHFRILSRRISMLNRMSPDSTPNHRGRSLFVTGLIGVLMILPWSLVRGQAAEPPVNQEPTYAAPTPQKGPSTAQPKKPAPKPSVQRKPISRPKEAKLYVFKLKHASATEVREVLAAHNKDKSVKIYSTSQTNSLIFTGPVVKVKALIEKARSLDKETKPQAAREDTPKAPEITVITAGKQDAAALAKKVYEHLRPKYDARQLSLLVDVRTNSILVKASPSIAAEVVDLVKKLDTEAPLNIASIPYRHPIKFHNADAIAQKILDEFGSRYDRSQLVLLVDPSSNSLQIKADERIRNEVLDRVNELDRQSGGTKYPKETRVMRRFRLANISAEQAMRHLWKNLPEDSSIDFLSYDPTDNSIVVRADDSKMELIGKAIAAVDKKGQP